MPDGDKPIREKVNDQPVRDRFESVTREIPEGPMGKVGGGNLLGAAGFVAVESTKPVWQFVPGLKQPGYKITAHGTKEIGEGDERHILTVVAISEEVARFAAKYTASPSNIDYLSSKITVKEINELTERAGYTTFEFVVDVERGEAVSWL